MESMALALVNCFVVAGVVVAVLPRMLADRLLLPVLLSVFLLWSFEFMLMLTSGQAAVGAGVRASLIVAGGLVAAAWIARSRRRPAGGADDIPRAADDALPMRTDKHQAAAGPQKR